jgi:hypothetical protein
MKNVWPIFFSLVFVFSSFLSTSIEIYANDIWQNDFIAQQPEQRPHLEARYTSAKREGFLIEAEHYQIELDLSRSNRHAIRSIKNPHQEVLTSGILTITDDKGVQWNTNQVTTKSRVNLYRRGPYYNEIHWLDLEFSNNKKNTLPVKGEVVFHSYPEFCRVSILFHAVKNTSIRNIRLDFNSGKKPIQTDHSLSYNSIECISISDPKVPSLHLFSNIIPTAKLSNSPTQVNFLWEHDSLTLLQEKIPKAVHFGFIRLSNKDATNELKAQLDPLQADRLVLIKGNQFRYDPIRGDYVVSTHNPGGFSYHFYENRNDYRSAQVRIKNNTIPRKIYLRHDIDTGSKGQVECGVMLDYNHRLLPILAQISKNFAGEKEEKFYNPEDTPFSEIIFPLVLDSNEECEPCTLQLYQDWGNHPLKQFSSLGAWMDYFHMSTGVTETTCYVPFRFYTGISIADFRPMSGSMWTSQPQHDNVGGHIFMEYLAADQPQKRQVIKYLGTQYHSTGPNWAHITFSFLSSDDRLQTTLQTFEYPQVDELRNFVKLTVKALDKVPINNWATDFRIMQIDTKTQQLRYQNVSYIDPNETTITKPIQFDDSWTLEGVPLSKNSPVAAIWNSPKGNNAFIIQDWHGTIGGKPLEGFALSCQGRSDKNSNLVLVPQSTEKGLIKGDQFEVDLMIMPFGKEGDNYSAAWRERERYGKRPVFISNIQSGTVLSHFPPRIRFENENLHFSVVGGHSTIAILVEGLPTFSGWFLEEKINNSWRKIVNGNPKMLDTFDGEGQQRYVCNDGTFGVAFRIPLRGRNEATEYRLRKQ